MKYLMMFLIAILFLMSFALQSQLRGIHKILEIMADTDTKLSQAIITTNNTLTKIILKEVSSGTQK